MQSGISVSQELHTAFNDLVSSPSTTRGILAKISAESIVPHSTIPTTTGSDFHSDLSALTLHLTPTQAFYIILRRHNDSPSGFVAVTYVPDSAPVRSKMLFASTRLTLVRELGLERFREQLFVTEAAELTKAGWERHEASGALKAPLTEEEQTLQGVKEAEAQARGGTQGKQLETGGKLTMAMSEDARTALAGLKDGLPGTLVQLVSHISPPAPLSPLTANPQPQPNLPSKNSQSTSPTNESSSPSLQAPTHPQTISQQQSPPHPRAIPSTTTPHPPPNPSQVPP